MDTKTKRMTKIEQLAALLVAELRGFEKNISKLESLETKISDTKIELNLKELKPLLEAHEQSLNLSKKQQDSYLDRLQSIVKNASFYPKWAIISFMSMIIICCLISFYAYTVKIETTEKEKIAYIKGEKAATEYINLYLSENPKALERYKKWSESK